MPEEYRVTIPDEVFAILEWSEDDLPAICVINQALANFEPKIVFAWHLSIIVDCAELADNGMPTSDETKILEQIGDHFDDHIKANGNALFLARITWNGTRQFLYRVYDPQIANAFLMDVIDNQENIRPFDFQMEHDQNWEHAKYFLKPWGTGTKEIDSSEERDPE